MTAIVGSLHTSFTSCSAYSRLLRVGLSTPRLDLRINAFLSAALGDSCAGGECLFSKLASVEDGSVILLS
jgi:hypothetical protein